MTPTLLSHLKPLSAIASAEAALRLTTQDTTGFEPADILAIAHLPATARTPAFRGRPSTTPGFSDRRTS